MNVIRASHAGFCMGVALALHKLDTIVSSRPGQRVATLGEIIHNPQVLEDYARRGVRCLRSVSEAEADMFTTVFVGNSQTKQLRGRMVTPRGYRL